MNRIYYRLLHTSCTIKNKRPINLKGKKISSQQWLTRQLNDPYVEKAKLMNYRCRSAFKLLEIDSRFKILNPGNIIIDCGAAPGSWAQVAISRTCRSFKGEQHEGLVIAIDKNYIQPIEDAVTLGNSDITSPEVQEKILRILGKNKADVVLSDMAPNSTGIREMDKENMLNLCYTALRFAVQVSKEHATFLVKLWQCEELKILENDIRKFYDCVKIVKPQASRLDSAEIFILGRHFKGTTSGLVKGVQCGGETELVNSIVDDCWEVETCLVWH